MQPQLAKLTHKQMQILGFVEHGLTNKAIAVQLNCTEKTIEAHLCRIYRKLQANNRTHAVMLAKARGLL